MITKKHFGTVCGTEAEIFTLTCAGSVTAEVTNYGATLVRLLVPDRNGELADIICGFDTLEDYMRADGYHGATVGRVCNRISKGSFSLCGKTYALAKNAGNDHLHGGIKGFDKAVWEVLRAEGDGSMSELVLRHVSEDGDEGYPGQLTVTVTYRLENDAVSIHFHAVTSAKTIVNLTNHSYFNLAGYDSGSIYEHILQLDADSYVRTDADLIPTGELVSVAKTEFDFRMPKAIGRDISSSNADIALAGGYDHCFIFSGDGCKDPLPRICVTEPRSGRIMTVFTNQPCVQLYTGNFLSKDDVPTFKCNVSRRRHGAFCLETQKMPDSINHAGFTDITLSEGEEYDFVTAFCFSTKK